MRKAKYSDQEIVKILGEYRSGSTAKDLGRKYKVSEQTVYAWSKKFGGMQEKEIKELKRLRAENAQLKRLFAESQLSVVMLKDLIEKKL